MPRIPLFPLGLVCGVLAGLSLLARPAAAQLDAFGSGAGWFDCNGDDYLDICYITPQGQIVLLVYDPVKGAYADSSNLIPLGVQNVSLGTGVACGDVNNDGRSDIFLTFSHEEGGGNVLLLNRGTSFQAVSRTAGIGGDSVLSGSAAMFDYDGDGLLDIYVANYGDPFLANDGWNNRLYHNTGVDQNGIPHFIDVAPMPKSGVPTVDSLGVERAHLGESNWTLGLAVGDYDNDGDMDLYLANDYNGTDPSGHGLRRGDNILYRNEGNGTFADVSYVTGAADTGWAMGAAFGDFDQDGWLDIFVSNFWADALLHNNHDGTFTNVTALSGMPTEPLYDQPCTVCNGWGTGFIDYDNDGDLDIHVANGYITNDRGQTIEEPDELWENEGVGPNGHVQFKNVGPAAGIASIGDGRGAAYGDVNRDGFVDILVMNNQFIGDAGSVPEQILYVNQKDGTFRDLSHTYGLRPTGQDGPAFPPRADYTGRHWIEVRPKGVTSNRSAIGSRVTVQALGKTWIQDVGASSYCSTNSPFLHFGLGNAGQIDRVTVRFPSGTTVVKSRPALDSFLTISENDPTPVRLLSFQVSARSEGPWVRWQVGGEDRVARFILAREAKGQSTDLASFDGATNQGEFVDSQAPRDAPLVYRLDALLRDGTRENLGRTSFEWGRAPKLLLGQNRPNPFSRATTIPIEGTAGGPLRIFDLEGRLIRELPAAPVNGSIVWDGKDASGRLVPSGTYFYRLPGSPTVLRMVRRP